MKVKSESEVVQSCLTLSDPVDCSLTGSSVHGIFQARVLEWGAIAFFEGNENLCSHKNMYANVYSSFIYHCQKLKITLKFLVLGLDKRTKACLPNGILLNNEKRYWYTQ